MHLLLGGGDSGILLHRWCQMLRYIVLDNGMGAVSHPQENRTVPNSCKNHDIPVGDEQRFGSVFSFGEMAVYEFVIDGLMTLLPSR